MKWLCAAVVLLGMTAPARAETVELPRTLARLVVPDEWTAQRARSLVAAYKRADGAVLAVTRADVPNADAWRPETKKAYADQVFAGIKASLPGATKLTKKLGEMNGIPALDVEAQRDGAPVLVRVLMFRTYALSLAIELPKGADIKAARAIIAAFGPDKPVPRD